MNSRTRVTLLDRLRDGADPLAWDEFFHRYWRLIYAFARGRGCSEHTAEEIVQEVMLKVFEQRDVFQYDPRRGRFRDWLGTLVRNKVAEHRRRPSQRVRAPGGDADRALTDAESNEAGPDAAWEQAFEQCLLGILLDVVRREVNPRCFLAFELSALHGLAGAKVAGITGLTRNAVYKARRRVFSRLKELSGTYPDDGQLAERIKQALEARPAAAAERLLTTRMERTMRSR